LDTANVPEGAYELTLNCGGYHLARPELIWILGRENYVALARQFGEERFRSDEVCKTAEDIIKLVAQLLSDTFGGRSMYSDLFDGNGSPKINSTVIAELEERVLAAPILWTTQVLADELNSLSIRGIESLSWFCVIWGSRLELGFSAKLLVAVSDEGLAGLSDGETSDLYLLNIANDLLDFTVLVKADETKRNLTVAVKHSLPEYEGFHQPSPSKPLPLRDHDFRNDLGASRLGNRTR
jgi:hypothetical protein